MRRLRPGSEAEMVALSLSTELPTDRFGAGIRALLERDGVPERVVTAPDIGDDTENQVRLRLLTEHRGHGNRTDYFPDDPGRCHGLGGYGRSGVRHDNRLDVAVRC
jgi:hypothetical protein